MNFPLSKEQIALLTPSSLTYRETIVEGTDGTFAAPRPSWLGNASRWAANFAQRIAELPRRRAVMAELDMLSDRELADIGLNRAELGSVFEPGFSRRAQAV